MVSGEKFAICAPFNIMLGIDITSKTNMNFIDNLESGKVLKLSIFANFP